MRLSLPKFQDPTAVPPLSVASAEDLSFASLKSFAAPRAYDVRLQEHCTMASEDKPL